MREGALQGGTTFGLHPFADSNVKVRPTKTEIPLLYISTIYTEKDRFEVNCRYRIEGKVK